MHTDTKTIDLVMLVDDNDTDNFISKRIIEITKFAKRVEVKGSGKAALDYIHELQAEHNKPWHKKEKTKERSRYLLVFLGIVGI